MQIVIADCCIADWHGSIAENTPTWVIYNLIKYSDAYLIISHKLLFQIRVVRGRVGVGEGVVICQKNLTYSLNWPNWAVSVIEWPCPYVCLSAALCAIFF